MISHRRSFRIMSSSLLLLVAQQTATFATNGSWLNTNGGLWSSSANWLSGSIANGTDALIAIRGEFPGAHIIMLSTSDGDGEIRRAMQAGASAYLLKSMPKDDLLNVIRAVHSGRRHIPPDVAARLAEHLGYDDPTSRELEVLRLIRDGYRNKQIADQLAIAETTVAFHIKNILNKLGANDRTHAVTIALRRGLLQI